MGDWGNLEYRLHARVGILHGTMPAVRLWYALRALDELGTGVVTIPVGQAEAQLGKSALTIKRYLADSTFFRTVRIVDGSITIYLQGIQSVCSALHLPDIGPVGFNEGLDQLQKDSALIGAIALQQASLYLATHDKGGPHAHDVIDATNITSPEIPSFITQGAMSVGMVTEADIADMEASEVPVADSLLSIGTLTIKTVSGRPQPIHMLHRDVTLYGASLQGVADLLQVCMKTVSRALRGVLRIRQAQQIPMWKYNQLQMEAFETLTGTQDGSAYPFYSFHNVFGPYRLHTYLYYPLHVLCSQRRLKAFINPRLKGGVVCGGL